MAPPTYLTFPVKFFYIPDILDPILGSIAIASIIIWVGGRYAMWRKGMLPVPHTMYVVIHIFMFWLSYIYIDVIEYGWMTIGIWHCAQYLLFVWAFNKVQKQHMDKVSDSDSQDSNGRQVGGFRKLLDNIEYGNIWLYLAAMLFLAWVVFGSAELFGEFIESNYFVPTTVIVGTVMFHHYIVDAIIWRRKKK